MSVEGWYAVLFIGSIALAVAVYIGHYIQTSTMHMVLVGIACIVVGMTILVCIYAAVNTDSIQLNQQSQKITMGEGGVVSNAYLEFRYRSSSPTSRSNVLYVYRS